MTRRSLPGEATSPSSSLPPSFPAAATTKIPLAVASLTESSIVRPDEPRSGIDLVHHRVITKHAYVLIDAPTNTCYNIFFVA